MERAAILRRVSTRVQVGGFSLDSQDEDCVGYCTRKHYEVAVNLEEVGSGNLLDEREALWDLRQRMRRHEFDVLVVWKLDRLTRNQLNQAVLLYEADKYGVRIESVTEELDASPLGIFVMQAKAFAAQVERESIGLRTVRNRMKRATEGLPLPGATPPYGYQWDEAHRMLLENPDTAPVVQRVFSLVGEHLLSLREVARTLSLEHLPTPKGGEEWNQKTLAYMLRNPVYWGKPVAWRWKHVFRKDVEPLSGRTRQLVRLVAHPEEEQIVLPQTAPVLVSETLAFQAQAVVAWNQKHHVQKVVRHEYLLRGGYARCGYCGGALSCKPKDRRRPTYVCTNGCYVSVTTHKLDPWAWRAVAYALEHPSVIRRCVNAYRTRMASTTSDELEAHERKLQALQEEETGIAAYLGHLTPAAAQAPLARLNTIAAEKAALDAAIREVRPRSINWQQVHGTIDRLLSLAPQGLSYEDRRLALYLLGIQVTVWKKEHTPRWDIGAKPFAERPLVEKNSTIVFPLGALFGEVRGILEDLVVPLARAQGLRIEEQHGTDSKPNGDGSGEEPPA